jgi:hypothetical protein
MPLSPDVLLFLFGRLRQSPIPCAWKVDFEDELVEHALALVVQHGVMAHADARARAMVNVGWRAHA